MHIISAVSWNGTSFTWNVSRNRWDMTDDITIGDDHAAEEGDLPLARAKAEDEGAMYLSDSAMLVDYDALLDDNS